MVVGTADPDHIDRVLHALADTTRREILALVLHGEYSVSDLARRFPMSFAGIQKHVAVLERAGLVSKRRNGREQLVTGEVTALRSVHQLLDQIESLWRARVDRMGEALTIPDDAGSSLGSRPGPDRPVRSVGPPAAMPAP